MAITQEMVNQIYRNSLEWKEEDNYGGEILRLAYDNNLWNNDCLALALMLSGEGDVSYCMSEITMLKLLNKCVTKKDGSKFYNFNENESKLVKLILENNIYDKWKDKNEN